MKFTAMLVFALTLCGAIAAPIVADAAGPGFCRGYANAAVRQARVARETPFCARGVAANPARWTRRWATHYDWCRSVPAATAEAERNARKAFLRECRRH